MPSKPLLKLAASALAVAAIAGSAVAAPGDVFVPAHRTRDGSYVPPNVAPLSGGDHMARRPARGRAVVHRSTFTSRSGIASPLFVAARPLRR